MVKKCGGSIRDFRRKRKKKCQPTFLLDGVDAVVSSLLRNVEHAHMRLVSMVTVDIVTFSFNQKRLFVKKKEKVAIENCRQCINHIGSQSPLLKTLAREGESNALRGSVRLRIPHVYGRFLRNRETLRLSHLFHLRLWRKVKLLQTVRQLKNRRGVTNQATSCYSKRMQSVCERQCRLHGGLDKVLLHSVEYMGSLRS